MRESYAAWRERWEQRVRAWNARGGSGSTDRAGEEWPTGVRPIVSDNSRLRAAERIELAFAELARRVAAQTRGARVPPGAGNGRPGGHA